MDEWFKDIEVNSRSIIGRNLSLGALAVKNDGGEIDAITASTITSRAFLNAVNKAFSAYSGTKTDSYSGATPEKEKDYDIDKKIINWEEKQDE